jgi:anhydro-N-acetylmuramic acid kinase
MEYVVTGVMSGTSLDGMDIACCSFKKVGGRWTYRILSADTLVYSSEWKQRLSGANSLSAVELAGLHHTYGHFIGRTVKSFLIQHHITHPGFIASHGHTIFHQPDKGFSFQLGSGAAIAAEAACPVVCDFRSLDIALGGQGAPLVPVGDKLLFGQFTACLNLGGFANVSFDNPEGERIAYDICPANFVSNHLVRQSPGLAYDYDPEGSIGRSGIIDTALLHKLNALPYYTLPGPKSLGKEWVDENILPLIQEAGLPLKDALRTFYAHVVEQIYNKLGHMHKTNMLLTGGGTYNHFLIELLKKSFSDSLSLVIPDKETVDFKEALVFAFLGLLRLLGHNNCLTTVSGCQYDHTGGAVYMAGTPLKSFAY